MLELKSSDELQAYKNETLTVFHFTADWCPDCRFLDPILPGIVENHSDIKFVTVDRDTFIEVCQEMDVYGIPSFVAYREGTEVGRFVSKDRKTKEEIEQFLQTI